MARVLRRLLQHPLGKLEYYAFARDTTRRVPAVPASPGVTVRLAEPADFPHLLKMMRMMPALRAGYADASALQRRLVLGDKCFLLIHEGKIAVVSWVRFDNATYRKAWLSVPLLPGEAYVAGTFTVPHLRSRGFGTIVAIERLRWMYEHGVRVAYSWVDTENPPMLRVMGKTAWHPVAAVSQFYPRGIRRPTFNIVRVMDADHPLAAWCAPDRIRFPGGIAIYRRGPTLPRNLTNGLTWYNRARRAAVAQPGRAPHL